MNGDNKPVAIVPDIKDHKTIYVVRVWKASAQIVKALPSCRFHNHDPCADLLGSIVMLLTSLLKALDRDDMHNLSVLRNLRSIKGA
jgi:hypothetical protein